MFNYNDVGADGRIYYHFNLGQTWVCGLPNGREYKVKIEYCTVMNDKQYYFISVNGKLDDRRTSAARLHFLLNQTWKSREVAAGEPVELPLLNEEVGAYFGHARAARVALMNSIDFADIRRERGRLIERSACASLSGEEDLTVEEKLYGLQREEEYIMEKLGYDVDVVRTVEARGRCIACGNTGLEEDEHGRLKPCSCARAIRDKIKRFCARHRLAELVNR